MTATVREALRFSAYLRQPYDVPQDEKDAVSNLSPVVLVLRAELMVYAFIVR